MARNRQRAKQRQAERRARRLADQERGGAGDGAPTRAAPRPSQDAAPLVPVDEDEHLEADEVEAEEEAEEEAGFAPRGRRIERGGERLGRDRPRVLQFLVAVWAELQRVEWPDRKTLTTLTGVVLGFVLIAGGYLGALDAIFSRIVKAIL